MTQTQLARRVGASSSAVCRWENGQSMTKRDYAERLDKELDAHGKVLAAWIEVTSGTTLPTWMQDAGRLVEEAVSIEYVSPVIVPGLLQSPEYARLVFKWGDPITDHDEIERYVSARVSRYEYLRKRNDPSIAAVFPETALSHLPRPVMTEQAKHLLNLIDAGVRVHLVPAGTLLMGITSPLFLVRLVGGGMAASTDHVSGNFVLDADEMIDRVSELVKRAYAAALPQHQSHEGIKELL